MMEITKKFTYTPDDIAKLIAIDIKHKYDEIVDPSKITFDIQMVTNIETVRYDRLFSGAQVTLVSSKDGETYDLRYDVR